MLPGADGDVCHFPMPPKKITISLLLTVVLALPLPALAFWGANGDNHASLNLKSGYDVNTVTTVTGQVIAIQTGAERPNVELEIEANGARMIICLGPQSYWAEQGVPFKPGDELTVHGSKAQGRDGIIYLLAQKITGARPELNVVLRDESGRPVWAGNGMRCKEGQRNNGTMPRRQPSPGGQGGGDGK